MLKRLSRPNAGGWLKADKIDIGLLLVGKQLDGRS